MINFVTSFSADGYKTYAKNMLNSVIENWKDDLKLTAYYHDFPEELVADLPQSPLIEYRNLNTVQDMLDYRERMKEYDGTMGGKTQYNWRVDAIKWCHKIYAMTDLAFDLGEKSANAGWMIWLDADTITTKPLSEERILNLFAEKSELVYLGRKDADYSETSFLAFNLNYESPYCLLGDMRGCYDIGEVTAYREWHDGFIFERLLKIYIAHGLRAHNLTPKVEGLAAFAQSPLSQYMVHFKGNLKNTDKLPNTVSPDVNLPRYKQLADLVRHYVTDKIIEVGTWNGGRAIEMALAAFEKTDKLHYIGFDLFEEATEETDRIELNSKQHNQFSAVINRLNDFSAKMKEKGKEFTFTLHQGDSKETLPLAKDEIEGCSFAYIDGGHSEKTVLSDYENLKDIPLIVFNGYFTKDADSKIVSDEYLGVNRLLESVKCRRVVLPSTDKVKDGGIAHLAVLIQDDSLPDIPDQLKRVPIVVRPRDCMPKDYIINNVNENVKLIKKWGFVKNCKPHDEHAIIVSAGPSLDYNKLREVIKKTNGVVLSVKHSYPKLLKENIHQWACVILDPRPLDGVSTHGIVRKDLFETVDITTKFLIASMTDISVTKYLMERTPNVYGWHAYSEAVRDAAKENSFEISAKANIEENATFVTGGTCAAMRAFGMAHILGFRNFHLFGFDCNIPDVTDDMKKQKVENEKPKYLPVETNGHKFWTTGELLAMAQDCERLFGNKTIDANISMYGENTLVSEVFKGSFHATTPHYLDYFNNE